MPESASTVRAVSWQAQVWPLANAFVISRGSKTEAAVVVAEVSDCRDRGRGEAVPYARYGETIAGCGAAIEQARSALVGHTPAAARERLQTTLPAGAARNALDCALWDLEARSCGRPVAELIGVGPAAPVVTAYTLSLDSAEAMAAKAAAHAQLPLLKLKLGGDGDAARMRAVRAARPDARLIADANEAWTAETFPGLIAVAKHAQYECIEQPLPVGADQVLAMRPPGIAVCADESVHTREDLSALAQRYDAINVKLDKAGGLTEALALAADAYHAGLDVMVGCMVATSLAMAPALLLAARARWVDLDGPLLLARDREHGLVIDRGIITPPNRSLWG